MSRTSISTNEPARPVDPSVETAAERRGGGCMTCGHRSLTYVRPYRNDSPHGRDLFGGTSIQTCDACALVQAVPCPSPATLNEYYTRDYRTGKYGSDVANLAEFPLDNRFYFNRGRSVQRLVSQHYEGERPRILDVGAGYGHILSAFGERYPEAERTAIESSQACLPFHRQMGVRLISKIAEEALPELDEKFDIITMSHSLEHVNDPRLVLELLREKLADDGVLYLEVPNIPAETLLDYPDHHWAPRYDEPHLTFFSVDTFRALAATCGFEPDFLDTAGPEYTLISGMRYHAPPLREFLQNLLPSSLFLWLRSRKSVEGLRVKEEESSFNQYGGFRIWIRGVFRKRPQQD